jgi:pimeloyl-ACP methyl ester carboxylesterase
MNRKTFWQAFAGIALLVVGGLWAFVSSRGYEERRVVAVAGACRVDMDIVQKRGTPSDTSSGSVVLFHGIAANKLIMAYLARSLAELGVTVYVPDLPGHGRTSGPFTPQTAQDCALSLVRGLAAGGMITPDRTILAGHSMGGAIALRIAPLFRPAGVIAISPAPMRAAHGVTPEKLLYQNPPPILPNTLITAGQFEPLGLSANAADLVAGNSDPSIEFHRLLGQTHVSVLFYPGVARLSQAWTARVLKISNSARLPNLLFFGGGLLGFLGILLLSGPFLREMAPLDPNQAPEEANQPGTFRFLAEVVLAAWAALFLLRYYVPLRVIGLFEGDYLASFFLIVGLLLILAHPRLAQSKFRVKPGLLLSVRNA